MKFTIKELLENYHIIVPQLQRDYAQGRDSERELRKSFVLKIKHALQNESKPLNLDFVYGYTKKIGYGSMAFIPLDGQQRLTTLWLIFWFLSPRENHIIVKEHQSYLKNFTYETRLSSKRFCQNLITQSIEIKPNYNISKQIMDASWFMAVWRNDPTILSMLNMLDTLQEEIVDKEIAWNNLINNKKITFDYIDIKSEEFKLTDELYIKMNSRGKPLTSFENFKAQFSSLLSSEKTNYSKLSLTYQGVKVNYQQYFAFNIDSKWMDLFWKYRDKVKIKTDDCIYRYINFIAEFLFYKDNPKTLTSNVTINFDFLNIVFEKKTNIDFLFNSLDFLSENKNISDFFESIFNELSTFDNYQNDYFLRSITANGFDVKDKVIFYTILQYCSRNNVEFVDDDLKDLVRIVRNLLFTVRQPNQSKRIEYTSNLRLTNVSDYCKFIDAIIDFKTKEKIKSIYQILSDNDFIGFAKDNIQNEKTKSKIITLRPNLKQIIHKLEENNDILGNTSNFKLYKKDIENKINAFLDIWSTKIDNSLIIRALLTINDYSVETHSYSALGEIWYFGCKGFWNRILTKSTDEITVDFSDILDEFLSLYINTNGDSTKERLVQIIDNYKSENRDWRYYFIKYNSMLDNPYLSLNLFTWGDKYGFNINSLGNSGTHPLHSYHLNPYLIELDQYFSSNKKVKLYWGRFRDISCIKFSKLFELSVSSKGWLISTINKFEIDAELIQKYKLKKFEQTYLLEETKSKDIIQIAIDFISEFEL